MYCNAGMLKNLLSKLYSSVKIDIFSAFVGLFYPGMLGFDCLPTACSEGHVQDLKRFDYRHRPMKGKGNRELLVECLGTCI